MSQTQGVPQHFSHLCLRLVDGSRFQLLDHFLLDQDLGHHYSVQIPILSGKCYRKTRILYSTSKRLWTNHIYFKAGIAATIKLVSRNDKEPEIRKTYSQCHLTVIVCMLFIIMAKVLLEQCLHGHVSKTKRL